MEIPDNNTWIDSSLEQDQQHHALYATDLPPLSQAQDQATGFYDQSFHQGLRFENAAGLQHASDFHHCELQQFSQAADLPGSRAANDAAGDHLANVRRVNKADREKMRRDKLNEQFTELASALDPDRPKNDKATILSDSVQELNELRAEVKRLKAEQSALLDESRDLTQEKSELREEKALLKSETDQLNSQLQQRLRLALSWTMDPSLMMGVPYPVSVPTAPTTVPAAASSPSSTSSPSPSPAASTTQQIMPPVLPPHSPYAMPLPPFAMHPYAMFANRPPPPGSSGNHLPYFPYFPPPPPNMNSTVERPFAQYPLHLLRYGTAQEPPFFQPDLPYKPLVSLPVASKPRDEITAEQTIDLQQQTDSEDSNPSQIEGGSSLEVKQEVQVQSFVKTLSPMREGSGSPSIRPAAA